MGARHRLRNVLELRRLRAVTRPRMDGAKATFRDFRKLSRERLTREERHRASRDLREKLYTFRPRGIKRISKTE